jgi:hypothetical protein
MDTLSSNTEPGGTLADIPGHFKYLTLNQRVTGSSPVRPTTNLNLKSSVGAVFLLGEGMKSTIVYPLWIFCVFWR